MTDFRLIVRAIQVTEDLAGLLDGQCDHSVNICECKYVMDIENIATAIVDAMEGDPNVLQTKTREIYDKMIEDIKLNEQITSMEAKNES